MSALDIAPNRHSDEKPEIAAATQDIFSSTFLSALPYETPYFLFDRRRVLDKFQEFRAAFPDGLIQYAMKANSELEILRILAGAGCGFEIASKYEFRLLQELQVSPDRIVYGTSVKQASHIREMYNCGVSVFAFDSPSELEKIATMAPGSSVYVRTLANDAGSVFKFSEKFGVAVGDIVPLLLRAKALGLHPYGISFHVGSQASDPKAWANTIEGLGPVMQELKQKGVILEVLNIGGGYPCDYLSPTGMPSLREIVGYTLEQYKRLPYQPKIMLEPGRGMIAETGVLVASVIAKIARKEHTWLFLDAGCYNALFETMAYQGSTRYPVASMHSENGTEAARFALAGPTGDSEDVMNREVWLPADIDVGDKVVLHHIGAYSLTAASPFNGFPKPEVYYIGML